MKIEIKEWNLNNNNITPFGLAENFLKELMLSKLN